MPKQYDGPAYMGPVLQPTKAYQFFDHDVTLVIGPQQTEFTVKMSLLVESAKYFKKAYAARTSEALAHRFVFRELRSVAAHYFIDWLHTGDLSALKLHAYKWGPVSTTRTDRPPTEQELAAARAAFDEFKNSPLPPSYVMRPVVEPTQARPTPGPVLLESAEKAAGSPDTPVEVSRAEAQQEAKARSIARTLASSRANLQAFALQQSLVPPTRMPLSIALKPVDLGEFVWLAYEFEAVDFGIEVVDLMRKMQEEADANTAG